MSEAITAILIVFIASLLFGIFRQKTHKPIGFGTFIYVAVGSCGLSLVATNIAPENPLPLLSGIITGIGFLGAGALIKTSDKIFGFTSAASIWLFAIFGLTVGVHEYTIATFIYGIIWIVLFIDKYLELKGIGSYQKKISITTNKVFPVEELMSEKAKGISSKIKNLKVISMEAHTHQNQMQLVYQIEGDHETINQIVSMLLKERWVTSCKLE